jgi:catalase
MLGETVYAKKVFRRNQRDELQVDPMSNIMSHPIQSIQEVAGAAGADPRPIQRATVFQGLNDGPASLAAKITGVSSANRQQDDAPYHTNNDGIPWLAPDHSKTIGGIPVVSDLFLMQKQQAFNRHKLLERMVHPCKFHPSLKGSQY